jgi:hypothetical protein
MKGFGLDVRVRYDTSDLWLWKMHHDSDAKAASTGSTESKRKGSGSKTTAATESTSLVKPGRRERSTSS